MSVPPVEERLQRLVGALEAPATATALQAIERRTQTMRRRRHVGVATAAAAGVVVAVIAVVVLRHGPSSERTVDLDPVQPGVGDGLPAFTLDLDGWEITSADEEHGIPAELGWMPADAELPVGDQPGAVQVFRAPGALMPTVYLSHTPVTEGSGQMLPDTVTIGGVQGRAWVNGDDVALTWNPHDGHTTVWLRTKGISRAQAVEFADGLVPRDDAIASPPGPDDRFGFDPTAPVAGLVEDPIAPGGSATVDRRTLVLSRGAERVRITVDDPGERAFEDYLGALMGQDLTARRVADHPAVLIDKSGGIVPGTDFADEIEAIVDVHWLHTATARVEVEIQVGDADGVDGIVGGIRQISEAEWQDILATAPRPSGSGS